MPGVSQARYCIAGRCRLTHVTMRRAAVFFCLGVLLLAALFPSAIVAAPLILSGAIAVTSMRADREVDALEPPLLAIVTPRHLARASLPSVAR